MDSWQNFVLNLAEESRLDERPQRSPARFAAADAEPFETGAIQILHLTIKGRQRDDFGAVLNDGCQLLQL
ncbi:MAG TPA: hypothetical protein PKO06_17695, partial [Candidatus Ozemobacteraceae bacterium]|nr:hypothetical protein [Candidatus Ozemobacteraceae bacterium]